MVRKIVFDALEDEGEVDELELVLNGVPITVYKPTTGQTAIMMAAYSEESNGADAAAALLKFYRGITEPEGYEEIKGILENPRIPDSLHQLVQLTEQVIEAFTANPTRQPTDYLPSRQSGGRSSTASRRPVATRRSTSRPRASATGSTRSSSEE